MPGIYCLNDNCRVAFLHTVKCESTSWKPKISKLDKSQVLYILYKIQQKIATHTQIKERHQVKKTHLNHDYHLRIKLSKRITKLKIIPSEQCF